MGFLFHSGKQRCGIPTTAGSELAHQDEEALAETEPMPDYNAGMGVDDGTLHTALNCHRVAVAAECVGRPQMNPLVTKLNLVPDRWYAWQMIPGYVGERSIPYCSPIFVQRVVPKKTGKSILGIDFVNVLYAAGVQDFSLDIRILKHCADYLVAELLYDGDAPDRVAVISHIEFGWIERFCPQLWFHRPPSSIGGAATGSVSIYLSEVFGLGKTWS
jgi:hypothetical protein